MNGPLDAGHECGWGLNGFLARSKGRCKREVSLGRAGTLLSTEGDVDGRDRTSGSEPRRRAHGVRSGPHDPAEGEWEVRAVVFQGKGDLEEGVVPSSAEVVVGLNNDFLPHFQPFFACNTGRQIATE